MPVEPENASKLMLLLVIVAVRLLVLVPDDVQKICEPLPIGTVIVFPLIVALTLELSFLLTFTPWVTFCKKLFVTLNVKALVSRELEPIPVPPKIGLLFAV